MTLRTLRILLFAFGVYLTTAYFFSVVSLAIGISYFIAFRKSSWKYHGLMLAWVAAVTTFILNTLGAISAQGLGNFPTNYYCLTFGPGTMTAYAIAFAVSKIRLRRRPGPPKWLAKLNQFTKKAPKYAKVSFAIAVVIAPTLIWWSTSVDIGVLLDNNPRLLWVHAPTTVNKNSTFQVTVECWDAYERLSAVYLGTVSFSTISYNSTTLELLPSIDAELPGEYTFTGQYFGNDMAYDIKDGRDNGLHVFTARIDTPGIHYILVNDSVTQNTYWSNPIMVGSFGSADPKIYWGDVHGHSALSDGTGSPEHHYYYGRYVACLDYCALTDHGETMQFEIGALDYLEAATNGAYDPNHFVTFQGIEWTQVETGHYTCIFSGDKLIKNPVLSFMVIPKITQLWSALDDFTNSTACRALALPHHTTEDGYIQDWTYINPKYVKIAEVTSVHGECLFEGRDPLNYVGIVLAPPEYTPGASIIDAFKMGYHMTLYASGDQHDGHPGHSLAHTNAFIGHQRPWTTWPNRNSIPYPSGITAVYALNLTRESVFTGLENQCIYASSEYGRPFLQFTVNGTLVGDGSTLVAGSADAAREIKVLIAQDGAPAAGKRPKAASVTPDWTPDWNATIEIIKNGDILAKIPINGPVANVTFIDTAPITGTSYGAANCILRDGKYYINEYSDNPIDPSTLNTGGADFYVVRLVGENGRMAYAGPIWVEVAP